MKDPAPEEEAPSTGSAEAAAPAAAIDDDAAADDAREAEEAPAPAKKRKKKKRKKAEDGDEPTPSGDAEGAGDAPRRGDDVPSFAASFPRDRELDALVEAFEKGDFARVRDEGPKLAKRTDRDDVRASARELVRRVDPDPLAVYLLAGAAALLVFLAGWYWSHPHAP